MSESGLRFVDEFRDPEPGAGAGRRDPGRRRARPPLQADGGVRRAHALHLQVRRRRPAARRTSSSCTGPGCPVCVIPMGRVDDGIAIAHEPGVIFTCFGDMMRVPGADGSLLDAKAEGADVRMVYSPLDALRIARENPDREVVFFAIGFETTAPSTALTLKRAKAEGVRNFSCFCNHVLDRAAAAGAARVARPAARRLHRPGPRVHRGGGAALRVHPGRLRQAGRDLGLRAARPPPVGPHGAAPARRGPLRGREPVHARRALRGQRRRRSRCWPRSSSCGRTSSGAGSGFISHSAPEAVRRLRRPRRRAALRGARASASPTPRPASAARC